MLSVSLSPKTKGIDEGVERYILPSLTVPSSEKALGANDAKTFDVSRELFCLPLREKEFENKCSSIFLSSSENKSGKYANKIAGKGHSESHESVVASNGENKPCDYYDREIFKKVEMQNSLKSEINLPEGGVSKISNCLSPTCDLSHVDDVKLISNSNFSSNLNTCYSNINKLNRFYSANVNDDSLCAMQSDLNNFITEELSPDSAIGMSCHVPCKRLSNVFHAIPVFITDDEPKSPEDVPPSSYQCVHEYDLNNRTLLSFNEMCVNKSDKNVYDVRDITSGVLNMDASNDCQSFLSIGTASDYAVSNDFGAAEVVVDLQRECVDKKLVGEVRFFVGNLLRIFPVYLYKYAISNESICYNPTWDLRLAWRGVNWKLSVGDHGWPVIVYWEGMTECIPKHDKSPRKQYTSKLYGFTIISDENIKVKSLVPIFNNKYSWDLEKDGRRSSICTSVALRSKKSNVGHKEHRNSAACDMTMYRNTEKFVPVSENDSIICDSDITNNILKLCSVTLDTTALAECSTSDSANTNKPNSLLMDVEKQEPLEKRDEYTCDLLKPASVLRSKSDSKIKFDTKDNASASRSISLHDYASEAISNLSNFKGVTMEDLPSSEMEAATFLSSILEQSMYPEKVNTIEEEVETSDLTCNTLENVCALDPQKIYLPVNETYSLPSYDINHINHTTLNTPLSFTKSNVEYSPSSERIFENFQSDNSNLTLDFKICDVTPVEATTLSHSNLPASSFIENTANVSTNYDFAYSNNSPSSFEQPESTFSVIIASSSTLPVPISSSLTYTSSNIKREGPSYLPTSSSLITDCSVTNAGPLTTKMSVLPLISSSSASEQAAAVLLEKHSSEKYDGSQGSIINDVLIQKDVNNGCHSKHMEKPQQERKVSPIIKEKRGLTLKKRAIDVAKQQEASPSRYSYSTRFPMDVICQGRLQEVKKKTAPPGEYSNPPVNEQGFRRKRISSVGQVKPLSSYLKENYPTARSKSAGRMDCGRTPPVVRSLSENREEKIYSKAFDSSNILNEVDEDIACTYVSTEGVDTNVTNINMFSVSDSQELEDIYVSCETLSNKEMVDRPLFDRENLIRSISSDKENIGISLENKDGDEELIATENIVTTSINTLTETLNILSTINNKDIKQTDSTITENIVPSNVLEASQHPYLDSKKSINEISDFINSIVFTLLDMKILLPLIKNKYPPMPTLNTRQSKTHLRTYVNTLLESEMPVVRKHRITEQNVCKFSDKKNLVGSLEFPDASSINISIIAPNNCNSNTTTFENARTCGSSHGLSFISNEKSSNLDLISTSQSINNETLEFFFPKQINEDILSKELSPDFSCSEKASESCKSPERTFLSISENTHPENLVIRKKLNLSPERNVLYKDLEIRSDKFPDYIASDTTMTETLTENKCLGKSPEVKIHFDRLLEENPLHNTLKSECLYANIISHLPNLNENKNEDAPVRKSPEVTICNDNKTLEGEEHDLTLSSTAEASHSCLYDDEGQTADDLDTIKSVMEFSQYKIIDLEQDNRSSSSSPVDISTNSNITLKSELEVKFDSNMKSELNFRLDPTPRSELKVDPTIKSELNIETDIFSKTDNNIVVDKQESDCGDIKISDVNKMPPVLQVSLPETTKPLSFVVEEIIGFIDESSSMFPPEYRNTDKPVSPSIVPPLSATLSFPISRSFSKSTGTAGESKSTVSEKDKKTDRISSMKPIYDKEQKSEFLDIRADIGDAQIGDNGATPTTPPSGVVTYSSKSEDESLSSYGHPNTDGEALASVSSSSTGSALSWGNGNHGPVARRDLFPLEDEDVTPHWHALLEVNAPDSDEDRDGYESDDDFDNMDAEMRRLEEKLKKFERELGVLSSGDDVDASKETMKNNKSSIQNNLPVPRLRQEDIDVLKSFSLPEVYPPVNILKTKHLSLMKKGEDLFDEDEVERETQLHSSGLDNSSSLLFVKPLRKLKAGERRCRSLNLQKLSSKQGSKCSTSKYSNFDSVIIDPTQKLNVLHDSGKCEGTRPLVIEHDGNEYAFDTTKYIHGEVSTGIEDHDNTSYIDDEDPSENDKCNESTLVGSRSQEDASGIYFDKNTFEEECESGVSEINFKSCSFDCIIGEDTCDGYLWRESNSDLSIFDFEGLDELQEIYQVEERCLFFIFEDDSEDNEDIFVDSTSVVDDYSDVEKGTFLLPLSKETSKYCTTIEPGDIHPISSSDKDSNSSFKKKRDISLVSAFKNSFRKAAKYLGPNPFHKGKEEEDIEDYLTKHLFTPALYEDCEEDAAGKYNVPNARVQNDASDVEGSPSSGEFYACPAVCVMTSDEECSSKDKADSYTFLSNIVNPDTTLLSQIDSSTQKNFNDQLRTNNEFTSLKADSTSKVPPPVPPRRSLLISKLEDRISIVTGSSQTRTNNERLALKSPSQVPILEDQKSLQDLVSVQESSIMTPSSVKEKSLGVPVSTDVSSIMVPLVDESPLTVISVNDKSHISNDMSNIASHKPTSIKQLKRKQQDRLEIQKNEDALESSMCTFCVGVPALYRGRTDQQAGNHNRHPSPHPRALPERRTWPPRVSREGACTTSPLSHQSIWPCLFSNFLPPLNLPSDLPLCERTYTNEGCCVIVNDIVVIDDFSDVEDIYFVDNTCSDFVVNDFADIDDVLFVDDAVGDSDSFASSSSNKSLYNCSTLSSTSSDSESLWIPKRKYSIVTDNLSLPCSILPSNGLMGTGSSYPIRFNHHHSPLSFNLLPYINQCGVPETNRDPIVEPSRVADLCTCQESIPHLIMSPQKFCNDVTSPQECLIPQPPGISDSCTCQDEIHHFMLPSPVKVMGSFLCSRNGVTPDTKGFHYSASESDLDS